MELTLKEAAARLGKTERQIRYMIQLGNLTAHKKNGRWMIALKAGSSPAQNTAEARKTERLREAVDDALSLPPPRRRYSITDLKAFQLARPLYQQTCQKLSAEHPAARHLREVIDQLAIGCHRFHGADKAHSYQQARDAACRAAAELALTPGAEALMEPIEQELLAAIVGLLRRAERRR